MSSQSRVVFRDLGYGGPEGLRHSYAGSFGVGEGLAVATAEALSYDLG